MGGNHRAGWQDRVVRCCCASRRLTHSLSPGSPDAFNPPGCCWRCRRRCFLSAGSRALSLTSGAGRGGSQPSGVTDLSDTSDRGVCLSLPRNNSLTGGLLCCGQPFSPRPLSLLHLQAVPVARSSCPRRRKGLLGKCVKADAANEPAWKPECKLDLIVLRAAASLTA